MDESKTTKEPANEMPIKTETTPTDAFEADVTKRMKLSHHLNQPAGTVQVVNFNKNGDLLCAGCCLERGKINNIGIIDWAGNDVKTTVNTEEGTMITDVNFLNADNYESQMSVVSIYDNGRFRCESIRPSGEIEMLRTYELSKERQKLAKCPDKHNELLSAATSGTICHIDLRCEKYTVMSQTIADDAKTKLQSLSHHPVAPQICASYDDYRVRTFDSRKFDKPVHEICPEKTKSIAKPAQISDAFYNYDGNEILAIYTDTDIFLLDSENKRPGEFIKTFYQMGYLAGFTNKTSFFGPKSEYVIVGDDGQRIAFIDKVTGDYVGHTALWKDGRWCSVYFLDLKPHPNLPILAAATSFHFSILSPKSTDRQQTKSKEKTKRVVKPKK